MAARRAPGYEWSQVAVLRVSTDPGGLELPADLDGPGEDGVVRQVVWLEETWRRDEVRAALGVASPALAVQVEGILAAGLPDARQVRRAVLAVASYLLRWQGRATPFGLFTAMGSARVGGSAKVRLDGHRVMARADAGWLAGILTRLHQCPELMDRLSVVASNAATIRGGRLTAPGLAPDEEPEELAPVEVSVRCTAPVRAVMEAAKEPVPFGELTRQIRAGFPSASPSQVRGLLMGLVEQGILLSSLRAPMSCLDALGYACDNLRAVDAGNIHAVSVLVKELAAIHQDITAVVDGPGLVPVTGRMSGLSQAAAVPLVVDAAADCDVRLPEQVGREARDAAVLLYRLSPYPSGVPAWAGYHERFLDRYGEGAAVPMLDLVADSGLGLPAGYLGSARDRPAYAVMRRDTVLMALAQQAMADGSGEIVLTDEVISDLSHGAPAEMSLATRAEIVFEVRAPTLDALNRGRFTLLVTGTPRPGSSMAGRYAHLLPAGDQAQLAETFAMPGAGAIAAQLSFAPRKRRNENVARTMQLLPALIPIGELPDTATRPINLNDLAVTADSQRLSLVRLSTGELVEPQVTHALETTVQMPPLARFLSEVSHARSAAYAGFDWGAASRLPYLPRVRYRRTILSPQRWLLPSSELPGPDAPMAEWEDALRSWRNRWRVPEHVAITDYDRRLPVDLRHPFHRTILRARQRRAGQLELRETVAAEDFGWLGRAHQIVLPLLAAGPRPAEATPSRAGAAMTIGTGHPLPGPVVLRAELCGHPDRFDEVLTAHLPSLVAAVGDHAAAWWFRWARRAAGADGGQRLAIYLPLPALADFGPAGREIAAWADQLHSERLVAGFTLSTDYSLPGLPGQGEALDAAHRVLAADSVAALTQAAFSDRAGMDRRAVAAASITDLAATLADTPAEGMDGLLRVLPREHGPIDPAVRDQALQLATAIAAGQCIAALPGAADVAAAWVSRADALRGYRQALAEPFQPEAVLRFLLTDHQARCGGNSEDGRVIQHLARSCALRYLATRQRA
jgi:thiopeptide-type bacteriocin biosynthesis protein